MSETQKTSNWQTFILLVKGNIGPGCLALPFCFSLLGPYASLGCALFIGFFCVYNMWVLVRCKRKIIGVKTYGELASATLGPWGEGFVEFFLALMQLSICCVYFSFIGDSIEPLLGIDRRIITIILVVPVLALTQLRHMAQLAPLSLIASALLSLALLLILSVSIGRLYHDADPQLPVFDSSKIVSFFVSTIYAFEGIGIILPIEDSMEHPQSFSSILFLAMATVTLVYLTLAETIILTFGVVDDAGITGFLLREGSLTKGMASLVSCLIGVAVFLSYPLQLYPALQVIEAYCGYGRDVIGVDSVSCCELTSSNHPSPSISGSPEYTRHSSKLHFRPLDSAEQSLLRPKPTDEEAEEQSPLVESNENLQKKIELKVVIKETYERRSQQISTNIRASQQSSQSIHFFPKSLIRICLVCCTSLVSTLVPNVGLLVSLAGASSGAALALVFPPLFDIVLHRQQKFKLSLSEILVDLISIFLGVLAAVLGTAVSIHDIFRSLRTSE